MKTIDRTIFPFGFLLSALLVFGSIALAGTFLFFFLSLKQDISTIEKEARSFLIPLLDACSRTAEIGSDADVSRALSPVFKDYQKQSMVYRAFFVKEDGTILAHSNPAEIDSLKNNIARDEFTYNLDQIFLPIKMKEENAIFVDYYIPEITTPFDKKQTQYIKEYIYPEINKNGWLIAKAVTRKNKPYGIVAFILEKSAIYRTIQERYDQAKFWSIRVLLCSSAVSFIMTFFMFFRYRLLIMKTFREALKETEVKPVKTEPSSETKIASGSTEKSRPELVFFDNERKKGVEPSMILDAIPLSKR